MNARVEPSQQSIVATVHQRDIDFGIDETLRKHWHSSSPHITHFFNAMSLLFPEGERFFIRSVRAHKEYVTDPQLQADVQGFIGQEAMHGREHQQYNDTVAGQGYPVEKLVARTNKRVAWAEKHLSPQRRLAGTIALEHFTAIMAHQVLSRPKVLEGAEPRMQRLWRWHAIEETEHKAVAYDVWRAVVADKPLGGYFMRCYVMLMVSLDFAVQIFRNYMGLLRVDQQRGNIKGWWQVTTFLWFSPAVALRVLPAWLAWFRPGFHPWQHNNRHLAERWVRELE